MAAKSSSTKLLIVGSVAFDSIETPFGKINKTLGGSASYFSLAAVFFAWPSVVAVVGDDFNDECRAVLKKNNIDLSGLGKTPGRTFAWGGKYSFDLNNRATLFTKLGVFEKFRPKLSVKNVQSEYVFLGNIDPALQLDVLSQIQKPKLVGLDTMNLWIEKTPKQLAAVLKKINIFVINDSEARELSGHHNLIKGAKVIMEMMGLSANRILIIKRGEYGLLMFQESSSPVAPKRSLREIAASPAKASNFAKASSDRLAPRNDKQSLSIFHLPGYPLEDVIDPTGAGDSFAGGFMGYLAKTNDRSWKNLKRACVYGSVMASFCCEQLGTKRLQSLSSADISKRYGQFVQLTNFSGR